MNYFLRRNGAQGPHGQFTAWAAETYRDALSIRVGAFGLMLLTIPYAMMVFVFSTTGFPLFGIIMALAWLVPVSLVCLNWGRNFGGLSDSAKDIVKAVMPFYGRGLSRILPASSVTVLDGMAGVALDCRIRLRLGAVASVPALREASAAVECGMNEAVAATLEFLSRGADAKHPAVVGANRLLAQLAKAGGDLLQMGTELKSSSSPPGSDLECRVGSTLQHVRELTAAMGELHA